jgi:hypothetical protein
LTVADESSNGSDPDGTQSAFERFERLARRLVSVPKAEVDAERKKRQAERRRAASRKRPAA